MSFNPDTLKPAQVVKFSWERTKPRHLDINFTGYPVKFTKNIWESLLIVNLILMNK